MLRRSFLVGSNRTKKLDDLDLATERARERLAENPSLIAKQEALGRERALIYKMLLLTGLRKGELTSLTVGQLELDVPIPILTLEARDEKNREGSTVPIRGDLADDRPYHEYLHRPAAFGRCQRSQCPAESSSCARACTKSCTRCRPETPLAVNRWRVFPRKRV